MAGCLCAALFAVYWLCRLELPDHFEGTDGLDGQRGFCFGVHASSWAPLAAEQLRAHADGDEAAAELVHKREGFLKSQDWAQLHRLVEDAGLLQRDGQGGVCVNVERTVAMLALTAIHDIMKNERLLPEVKPEHAPFNGFEAGDVIQDHDIALGYVLTHDAGCLPCYAALGPSERAAVRFTQAKMGFNHGWLVQAEAPPGPLFSTFKALIQSGGAANADVAFYFLHWLTDLAGAEPSPLRGCEKFVLKFPGPVLASFVRSFPIVQGLAERSMTSLMESFLLEWWPSDELGSPPRGPEAVALMRLVVQAQSRLAQLAVRDAFEQLNASEASVLCTEMARTGVADEAPYESLGEGAQSSPSAGPAFLVYYSPAFVRQSSCTVEGARLALSQLAATYAAARSLFPLSEDDAAKSVTVRIDQLKALPGDAAKAAADMYSEGGVWVLVKKSKSEACVELWTQRQLFDGSARPGDVCALPLWEKAFEPDGTSRAARSLGHRGKSRSMGSKPRSNEPLDAPQHGLQATKV